MNLSVVDPITPAIDRTKLVLFQPFDIGKWLKLGFCAFLACLGSGGGGSNFSGNMGNVSSDNGPLDLKPAWRWVGENLPLIIGIGLAIVVIAILIGLIVTWLSSRGRFMFIDGIVHNRGAVVAPWNEFAAEANSLFWFRVAFGVSCFAIAVLLIGGCLLIAMPSIQAKEFTSSAGLALALGIPSMTAFAITAGLVAMFLTHMVVPIMYLRRVRVMEAWRLFRHEILAGRKRELRQVAAFQRTI